MNIHEQLEMQSNTINAPGEINNSGEGKKEQAEQEIIKSTQQELGQLKHKIEETTKNKTNKKSDNSEQSDDSKKQEKLTRKEN